MVFWILFGLGIAVAYLLDQHWHSYWTRLGFKQSETKILIGNVGPLLFMKTSFGELITSFYNKYKEHKIVGIYFLYNPILIVNDPILLQDIMIRDFSSFTDRTFPFDEVNDPLSAHLFNLPGQKWRDLRVKLSPTFTSGKLKGMFSIIRDCGQVLETYLVNNVKNGVDVFEFRDLMARFNTNIISSVAFGIENDCINEPDHLFRRMGIKIFDVDFKKAMKGLAAFLFPPLARMLKFKSVEDDVEDFIYSIVRQTIEHREQKNLTRNDFMQLLIQLKNQGYVSVDKSEKVENESEELKNEPRNTNKLTIDQIAAQVFVFFIAGFETSSSTMSFCLYELAKNQKLQQKAQKEIDKVFGSAGKDGITYDMLGDLKYMECCIDETLRKYPIVPLHLRKATKDYKIAGTDLMIPNGTEIMIPVLGFHRDSNIYDDPMEFIPERFTDSPNGGGKVSGLFYTPFGDGPRNCIGMRMGKLTTKLGLALILSKFNLELNDKSLCDKELDFHPNQFILTPLKPFDMKITPRSL